MRIYYDSLTGNVVLGTTTRLFATGSLEAVAFRGRVAIAYKQTNFREVLTPFDRVQRQDGTAAGATLTEVLNYLNSEFNKTLPRGGGGGVDTELRVDGGVANTIFTDYVLRLDFGITWNEPDSIAFLIGSLYLLRAKK